MEVVVSGRGSVTGAEVDVRPWLRVRKMRKFMGLQDRLAVVAAGRALEDAGLGRDLGERAGLYMAVGYLPFVEEDIERLLTGAIVDGRFSMQGFASEGYNAVNPLLTFRCLSNMPAFHVSSNFGIQGPYLVSYPGQGQMYQALEEAHLALRGGMVEVALVVGVAHQDNFLVRHHFARVEPPVAPEALLDGAGCLVLEAAARAEARGAAIRARRVDWELSYQPHDPLEEDPPAPREVFAGVAPPGELGPATLPVALCSAEPGELRHEVETRDGFRLRSQWVVGP